VLVCRPSNFNGVVVSRVAARLFSSAVEAFPPFFLMYTTESYKVIDCDVTLAWASRYPLLGLKSMFEL
jgi:hypothetical protein